MVRMTGAERMRSYRARRKAAGLGETPGAKAYRKAAKKAARIAARLGRPFIACDGEGCGTDELGRQLYMLFRMGERELFTGHPLGTAQLLDFICDAPRDAVLVGFSFGYDITMILRDLNENRRERLLRKIEFGEGVSRYTIWNDFQIEYLPRNYLRVRRIRVYLNEMGERVWEPVPGSQRTIWEVFGFFQQSFVKVLEAYKVASPRHLAEIARNKAEREGFTAITPAIRRYCALECRYLAQVMERLREDCESVDLRPHSWSGAGKLAQALHRRQGTITAARLAEITPHEVREFASLTYYGGRFEIAASGFIGPTWENDINSAYPAAMLALPCLEHATWVRFEPGEAPPAGARYWMATAKFAQKPAKGGSAGQLGTLPIRSPKGHLYWPLVGAGAYWNVEIQSAERRGAAVTLGGGWACVEGCSCEPNAWVADLYAYRKELDRAGKGGGKVIKTAIASLYGKLAQRVGQGKFSNLIWASLITAITRAKLNDAIALAEGEVVMVATDAVYSRRQLVGLDVGAGLGQWGEDQIADMFVVQPGLYWDRERVGEAKRKAKSRGLSPSKFFEQDGRTEGFEAAWRAFQAAGGPSKSIPFPEVGVQLDTFIGLKLAQARGKPQTAGMWLKGESSERRLSFDPRIKRTLGRWEGAAFISRPKTGGPDVASVPHRENVASGVADAFDAFRRELDDMPDFVDLGPPGAD